MKSWEKKYWREVAFWGANRQGGRNFIAKELSTQREELIHETENGYCCACDYDIAGFETQREELLKEIEGEVEEALKEFDINYLAEWRWVKERPYQLSATDWLKNQVLKLINKRKE